ncbi:MAG: hypothetical protein IJ300_06790 [Clostridia bacterium]|nr:hypothetical protein [Clostridia bacterium]
MEKDLKIASRESYQCLLILYITKLKGDKKMNKENKTYKLKSIFEKYKDYTKFKYNYSASIFARKLQHSFKKYKLNDYLPIIMQKDHEHKSHHKQTYFFTEQEMNMVSLFMCSSAPKYGKSKKDFDEEKLNPFPWSRNGCNTKLSELQCYMEHLLNYIDNNKTELNIIDEHPNLYSTINYHELKNINYKIQLSVRLKKILERILTILYFQDKFDYVIFEYMLSRLEGFADEFDIIKKFNDENSPSVARAYDSADVSIAASLGDALVYGNYYKNNKVMDIKEILDILGCDSKKKTELTNELTKIIKLRNESLSTKGIAQHIPKPSLNYMDYIGKIIEDMVNDYRKIYRNPENFVENEGAYLKKYGISIDDRQPQYYRLETVLYEAKILRNLEEIISENFDTQKYISETKKEIQDILDSAKKDTERLILEEPYQISSVLDILLFKPFIRFHDLDIKELERRVTKRSQDNPIY